MAGGRTCDFIRVTRRAIGLAEADRRVEAIRGGDETGAVVAFSGIVRRTEGERAIRSIRYEAYKSMAEREMRAIAAETRRRWTVRAIVAIHRVGIVAVGESSVAVAVSAGHRADAFAAARFLIDTIKERAPIWKHFVYINKSQSDSRLVNAEFAAPAKTARRRGNLDKMSKPPGVAGQARTAPDLLVAVPVMTLPPSSPGTFAKRVIQGGANAIELRLDALVGRDGMVPERLAKWLDALRNAAPRLVVILTPRCREEGGVARWEPARRAEAVAALLPRADAVDLELVSLPAMGPLAETIQSAGRLLILSFHDFEKTPSRRSLDALSAKAGVVEGALFKVAAMARKPGDVARLCQWVRDRAAADTIAAMPMGPDAAAGRVACAALGSRLAFATLGEASAPGQIAVSDFMRALRAARRSLRALPSRLGGGDIRAFLGKIRV